MAMLRIPWRDRPTAAARRLYERIVAQARRPVFYSALGVPDTPTGRFEMICLHAHVVLRRLKALGPDGNALGQATHDLMFADMDRQLREMGVGDLGVGRRVKKLAASLYGRLAVYDAALDRGPADTAAALQGALRSNLYATAFPEGGAPGPAAAPTDSQVACMACYLWQAVAMADTIADTVLLDGAMTFPDPQDFLKN